MKKIMLLINVIAGVVGSICAGILFYDELKEKESVKPDEEAAQHE